MVESMKKLNVQHKMNKTKPIRVILYLYDSILSPSNKILFALIVVNIYLPGEFVSS